MNNIYKIKIHNSDGSSSYYGDKSYTKIGYARSICTRMIGREARWRTSTEMRTFTIEEYQLNLVAIHEVR